MNPVMAALMTAARGHADLPPTVTMGGSAPPQGAQPAQMPPSGSPGPPQQGGSSGDKQAAEQVAHVLVSATLHVSDPELKAVFSTALSSLHKYLASDAKEQQQALQGKMSPKVMARANGVG